MPNPNTSRPIPPSGLLIEYVGQIKDGKSTQEHQIVTQSDSVYDLDELI